MDSAHKSQSSLRTQAAQETGEEGYNQNIHAFYIMYTFLLNKLASTIPDCFLANSLLFGQQQEKYRLSSH